MYDEIYQRLVSGNTLSRDPCDNAQLFKSNVGGRIQHDGECVYLSEIRTMRGASNFIVGAIEKAACGRLQDSASSMLRQRKVDCTLTLRTLCLDG